MCQKNLPAWHRRTFKRADEEVVSLEKKLDFLTAKDSSYMNWEEIKTIQKEIDKVWEREEKY